MHTSTTTQERVMSAHDTYWPISQAYFSARGVERVALRSEFYSALTELNTARDIALKEFEDSHGWQLSRRGFGLCALGASGLEGYPIIDHRECFVDDAAQPVAIVSHTLCSFGGTHPLRSPHSIRPWEYVQAYAEHHGLAAELLPSSWYWPDGALGVVFTRGARP
jgi:hypothetical protein